MTTAYFEEHPTDPDKVIMRKPPHDVDLFWRAVTTPEKWVGLTVDEILSALESVDPETKRLPKGFADFAYAVEAKLKEKNCG